MSVEEVPLPLRWPNIPQQDRDLIRRLDSECTRFFATGSNRPHPLYQPCDLGLLYQVLNYICQQDLALGTEFLEWGCGLGLGVCVADRLGFESCGIDINPSLIEIAASHLQRFARPSASVHCTSYFPNGYAECQTQGGHEVIKEYRTTAAYYEDLDRETNEIDVFFVYPWPHQQEMMLSLFDQVAANDALLITYYGEDDICLYRKS